MSAAARLAAAATDWVAVAADPAGPVTLPAGARGSFAGYGVDVSVTLDPTRDTAPDPLLPLPALVAGWLRAQAGARRVTVHLVPPDLPPDECQRLGADIAAGDEPVGLLVLADGSNRHAGAAARRDDRAVPFDAGIAAALGDADPAALLAVDPGLAAELGARGRAAWQVLAGAVLADGSRWSADLLYSDQPFGVAYHVAVWDPDPS